jgi:2-dehydro-3-deoxyphosphooctonate aldolase (KDO 8-P synthase)
MIDVLNKDNFFLIAGPCAVEDEESPFEIAKEIKRICDSLDIPFIFKGSFKKANRTKLDSFTGIGDEKALKVLQKVGKELNVPTLTDIHESKDAELAAKYVDILQIPAFLCRQTDLLIAASKTGKKVNIKKAQFLEASSMEFAVDKVRSTGNKNVWLTERGTAFGYKDLVVDFTGLNTMQKFAPTILDCTHSLQQPNQSSGITGGKPEQIEAISKAGIACGVDGIFIETHPDPKNAKSDGANMLKLENLEPLLKKLVKIRKAIL